MTKPVEEMTPEEMRAEIEMHRDQIENVAQYSSETFRSWEDLCYRIWGCLGLDFGDPPPDVPERGSYYARKLELLEEAKSELIAENFSLNGDAGRWRALTGSQRIKVLGSTGFHHEDGKISAKGEILHFGIEAWNVYGEDPGEEARGTECAVKLLTAYADAVRAGKKKAKTDDG